MIEDDISINKIKSIYNIGVICDLSWDNYLIMNKYLKKVDYDYFKFHTIYFKNSHIIQKANNDCFVTLIKHSSNNLLEIINNLFNIIDFWLIFTNNIEYLTPSHLVLNKCKDLNVNHIVITEYLDNCEFYLNDDIKCFDLIKNKSFKKFLKFLLLNEIKINKIKYTEEYTEEYTKEYNKLFLEKIQPEFKLTPQIINKIKESYNHIENSKHQIKILYDKDEAKKEKEARKMKKQTSFLMFSENKQKFIKSFKNQ